MYRSIYETKSWFAISPSRKTLEYDRYRDLVKNRQNSTLLLLIDLGFWSIQH